MKFPDDRYHRHGNARYAARLSSARITNGNARKEENSVVLVRLGVSQKNHIVRDRNDEKLRERVMRGKTMDGRHRSDHASLINHFCYKERRNGDNSRRATANRFFTVRPLEKPRHVTRPR